MLGGFDLIGRVVGFLLMGMFLKVLAGVERPFDVQIREATVLIPMVGDGAGKGHGTGCFISTDQGNFLVTSDHVYISDKSLILKYGIDVDNVFSMNHISYYSCDNSPATLAVSDILPETLQDVFVSGYPFHHTGHAVIHQGRVSSVEDGHVMLDITAVKGMSGGPVVVNLNGKAVVIGVVSSESFNPQESFFHAISALQNQQQQESVDHIRTTERLEEAADQLHSHVDKYLKFDDFKNGLKRICLFKSLEGVMPHTDILAGEDFLDYFKELNDEAITSLVDQECFQFSSLIKSLITTQWVRIRNKLTGGSKDDVIQDFECLHVDESRHSIEELYADQMLFQHSQIDVKAKRDIEKQTQPSSSMQLFAITNTLLGSLSTNVIKAHLFNSNEVSLLGSDDFLIGNKPFYSSNFNEYLEHCENRFFSSGMNAENKWILGNAWGDHYYIPTEHNRKGKGKKRNKHEEGQAKIWSNIRSLYSRCHIQGNPCDRPLK